MCHLKKRQTRLPVLHPNKANKKFICLKATTSSEQPCPGVGYFSCLHQEAILMWSDKLFPRSLHTLMKSMMAET